MRPNLLRLLVIAALCAGRAVLAGEVEKSPADNTSVKLQSLDFDGIQKLIAAHKGKVVVVDYWSTACPPCIKEFPELIKLQGRVGRDKLTAISVSLDYDGSDPLEQIKPPVIKFLERQKATITNVLCSEESDTALKKAGFAAIPAVLVYDQQGKLRERVTEAKSKTEGLYGRVNQLVDELLK